MTVTLASGAYGWDYVIECDESGDYILVQSDWDYPGVARTFGWDGDDGDLAGAQEWLDDHIGESAEDPGYFG